MFCEHCGNKLNGAYKFCTKCGQPNSAETSAVQRRSLDRAPSADLDQKWWLRLAKVVYIFFYVLLAPILYGVWSANSSSYNYSTSSYSDTSGSAFWYSLLTLIIYIAVLRLIKITFLYIVFGQKAYWKKEFKKLF
jgi:hypothetical protein